MTQQKIRNKETIHNFLQINTIVKETGFAISAYYICYLFITPNHWSCYRVSIHQFYKNFFFYLCQNAHHAMQKKQSWHKTTKKEGYMLIMIYYVWWDWLEIKNLDIAVWSCCSKRLLFGIHVSTISICDSVSQFNDCINWKCTTYS